MLMLIDTAYSKRRLPVRKRLVLIINFRLSTPTNQKSSLHGALLQSTVAVAVRLLDAEHYSSLV